MIHSRVLIGLLALAAFAPAQAPLFQLLDNPVPTATGVHAAGDLDGDGDLDLIGPGAALINDGHGRFVATSAPSLAFYRQRAKLADLNGDGLADLVSLIPTATLVQHIRIDLNLGGLAFAQAQLLMPGPTSLPDDFAIGDVDGDGDHDVIAGTWNGVFSAATASMPAVLWLNSGLGAFVLAPAAATPAFALPCGRVILNDVDADGDLDAVFANGNSGSFPPYGVFVAINSGGTFTASPTPFFPGAATLELGRFNADALTDVVITSGATALLFLNSPAGFLPPVASPLPPSYVGFVAVDLNGDGIDELVRQTPPNLSIHQVLPGGVLGPATQSWTDLGVLNSLKFDPVAGDLDGDGDRDLIAFRTPEAVALMNDGNGSLIRIGGRVTNVAQLDPSAGHHVTDVDGDGDLDTIGRVLGSFTVVTGLNDGDGFFGAGPLSPVAGPASGYYSYYPFDRDADGDADLYVTLHMGGAPGLPGPDHVYDNVGGAFTLFATVPSTADARGFLSADFDGDGDRDVVLGRWQISSTPAGPMSYVANLGAAGFAAPLSVGTNHHNYDLDLGDFDGNGTLDVFQTNKYGSLDPCVVYLGSGTGSFTPVTVSGLSGYFAAAGDLNGDAMADVVVDGQVRFSAGAGSFVPGLPLPSALIGPASLVDVDLDGDLDLVETPATVMFNAGGGVFGSPVSYLPRVAATNYYYELPSSAVVDVDRDGDPDIVAPGPLVFLNTTRQLARASIPRPGRPGSVDLYGTPGGAWFLFGSTGTTSFSYPPWGNVLIDPASAQLGAMGLFAAAGPTAGSASFGVTLPNNPALVGSTTYWQAIDAVQMRFTNRLTVTVMGY